MPPCPRRLSTPNRPPRRTGSRAGLAGAPHRHSRATPTVPQRERRAVPCRPTSGAAGAASIRPGSVECQAGRCRHRADEREIRRRKPEAAAPGRHRHDPATSWPGVVSRAIASQLWRASHSRSAVGRVANSAVSRPIASTGDSTRSAASAESAGSDSPMPENGTNPASPWRTRTETWPIPRARSTWRSVSSATSRSVRLRLIASVARTSDDDGSTAPRPSRRSNAASTRARNSSRITPAPSRRPRFSSSSRRSGLRCGAPDADTAIRERTTSGAAVTTITVYRASA